ncbi:hypothetical protein D3C76_21850 [compost metagenome]
MQGGIRRFFCVSPFEAFLTAAGGLSIIINKFRSGEVSSMSDSDDPESSNTAQIKHNLFVIDGVQA